MRKQEVLGCISGSTIAPVLGSGGVWGAGRIQIVEGVLTMVVQVDHEVG